MFASTSKLLPDFQKCRNSYLTLKSDTHSKTPNKASRWRLPAVCAASGGARPFLPMQIIQSPISALRLWACNAVDGHHQHTTDQPTGCYNLQVATRFVTSYNCKMGCTKLRN